jgi:hypothetical protein
MADEKDFEALGRYVDARERATFLEVKRHDLAVEIGRKLQPTIAHLGGSAGHIVSFEHGEVSEKFEEFIQANIDLEKSISDVNFYAEYVHRPTICRA